MGWIGCCGGNILDVGVGCVIEIEGIVGCCVGVVGVGWIFFGDLGFVLRLGNVSDEVGCVG